MHSAHLESQLKHAFNSNQEINSQLHSLQLNYKSALEAHSIDEVNLHQQLELERNGMTERELCWGNRVAELENKIKDMETAGEVSRRVFLAVYYGGLL